jgi:NTP pyrophosphatase (non-canonical NTP hydrolase)
VNLNEYQSAAVDTAIYPGQGTPLGLSYVALKYNGEAGEFAEHLGKAIRDDAFGQPAPHLQKRDGKPAFVGLTPERRALLKKELGDGLWYIAAAAKELGYTLDEIAAENIAKLRDRKERGVLGGSGDNR